MLLMPQWPGATLAGTPDVIIVRKGIAAGAEKVNSYYEDRERL
jgi:hypothetical protein